MKKPKVQIGQFVRVENTERKFGSAHAYHGGWVAIDGEVRPLMLTSHDVTELSTRSRFNREDMPILQSDRLKVLAVGATGFLFGLLLAIICKF